jgi:hypothetical protein
MEIRQRNYKYWQKLSVGTLVLGLVTLSMTMNVRNAWADPHGMFYTAIGQQQLFFNVLAALDQADYVETAFDREARRQAREAVSAEQPFTKETESGGRFTTETEVASDSVSSGSTQPGTPTLLNRAVTLDGADLYTDDLVREFGAESARRNAAAELLQTLCDYGFGIKECDNEIKPGLTPEQRQAEVLAIEEQRRSAVVVDPLDWGEMWFTYGVVPALGSGTPFDEQERQRRLLDPEKNNTPYAYSAQIDYWRKQIAALRATDETEGLKQEQYFNKLVNGVISSMTPARRLRIWPFVELVSNESGGYDYRHVTNDPGSNGCWPVGAAPPCLSYDWGRDSGYANAAEYIDDVDRQAMAALDSLHRIAEEAAVSVESQQDLIEDQGVLADTSLINRPAIPDVYPAGVPALSAYGNISYKIDNPVAARSASIYGIPNVLGQLATSQQASALTGLDNPGGVQLVKRSGSSGTPGSGEPACSNGVDDDADGFTDYPQDPECYFDVDTSESEPGAQSAIESTGPQVAGALDLLFKPSENFFDEEKDPTSPSANIISPILEFGARHALRVMTAGKWRPGTTAGITCGYTCD